MEMDDQKYAFQDNLVALIDSVAAGGTTRLYGQVTPYLDDLEEFLCMWFDDQYDDPQRLVRLGAISREEAEVYDQFNETLEAVYPGSWKCGPLDIGTLQSDVRWQSVVQAAKEAQKRLHLLKR